jgi:hypothetical protein
VDARASGATGESEYDGGIAAGTVRRYYLSDEGGDLIGLYGEKRGLRMDGRYRTRQECQPLSAIDVWGAGD